MEEDSRIEFSIGHLQGFKRTTSPPSHGARHAVTRLFYITRCQARCDLKHVMEAIRKMEPAWVKTCGSNFRLTSRTIVQPNGGTREVPCYQLTKTECLYIAMSQRAWHRVMEGLSHKITAVLILFSKVSLMYALMDNPA